MCCLGRNTDFDECLTGQYTCSIYDCNLIGLCQGNVIESFTIDSNNDCLNQCKGMSDCKWFSYSYDEKTCITFSFCYTLDEEETEFVSGQVECDPEESSKIMVTTGHPTNGENVVESTEVIDLANPFKKCKDLDDYPILINAAEGGLVQNEFPLVCGEYSRSRKVMNSS